VTARSTRTTASNADLGAATATPRTVPGSCNHELRARLLLRRRRKKMSPTANSAMTGKTTARSRASATRAASSSAATASPTPARNATTGCQPRRTVRRLHYQMHASDRSAATASSPSRRAMRRRQERRKPTETCAAGWRAGQATAATEQSKRQQARFATKALQQRNPRTVSASAPIGVARAVLPADKQREQRRGLR